MDINRTTWNQQQQKLKVALSHPDKHPEWRQLFLHQHTQVHSSQLTPDEEWSFEDEVMLGLGDNTFRQIPGRGEHSIAWILFHLARIEDVTMNMLVGDNMQLAEEDDWLEKMCVSSVDTGNTLSQKEVEQLSQTIDISALRAYRLSVGRRTCQLINQLLPGELHRLVDRTRLEKVRLSGAIASAASGILDYWGKRTIAGLLLMPPTRHCFLHLNEALKIKRYLSISN